jgi:hypothetical protein
VGPVLGAVAAVLVAVAVLVQRRRSAGDQAGDLAVVQAGDQAGVLPERQTLPAQPARELEPSLAGHPAE